MIYNTKCAIGESVQHKTFGHGIIIGFSGVNVIVKFGTDKDSDIHAFPFPEIFNDARKLLTSDSTKLNMIVMQETKSHICEKCGRHSVNITIAAGKNQCPECLKKLVKCTNCGQLFELENCICLSEYPKKYQCKTCYDKTHFVCSICNEFCNLDYAILSPYINDGMPICDSCAENEYTRCKVCNVWMPVDIAMHVEFYNLCPSCAKEKVTTCLICGEQMIIGESNSNQICYKCEDKKSYIDYILSLDICSMKGEFYSFYSFKQMKTLKIMSRLRHCYDRISSAPTDASFDILFLNTFNGDLVVIWKMPDQFKYLRQFGCTLTHLKKIGYNHLFDNKTCVVKKVVVLPNNKNFHIWESPYHLSAETIADRNYGDRYNGDDLVEEGNKFGDTSDFFIIGYIDK